MQQELIAQLYDLFVFSAGVEIDSRKVAPGQIFFALGQKDQRGIHRGAAFAEQAMQQGALAVVINDPQLKAQHEQDPHWFLVEDVEQALQALAVWHRQRLHIPIIAIVGSNGKTTTKELATAVLSQAHRVFSTPGNLNNHLGVPLCLLRLRGQEDLAVLELGANHLGETRMLCEIAQPNYGLITNCGKDHLGEYGSWENVIQANTELYDYLAQKGGKALVNAADALLLERSALVKDRYFYGGSMSDWQIEVLQDIPLSLKISDEENSYLVKTQFFGAFWQENIAHALALGQIFAVALPSACAALEAYRPQNLRSEWRERPPHQFLLDCYNANPSSMAHFVQAAQSAHAPNKVLILGEMLELGQYSQEEHQTLAQSLDPAAFQAIVFIGKEWSNIERPAHSHYFQQTAEAKAWLEAFLPQFPQGVLVLLKGSRGNRLEGVVE